MLIDIGNNDYLPHGRYALWEKDKIQKAKKALPTNATKRSILIEYDKIGGRITDVKPNVPFSTISRHTFWNIEKQKMSDSVENLSDDDLYAIIRKAENTNVPGSRYQRANNEFQIRTQKKLLDITKNKKYWHEKPIGIIILTVIATLIAGYFIFKFGWNR